MLTPQQQQQIVPRLLVIQIIFAAILAGAIIFASVIASTVNWAQVSTHVSWLTLAGLATGCLMLVLSTVIPNLASTSTTHIAAQMIPHKQDDDLDERIHACNIQVLQTSKIIFLAIIEAAIFLNMIVLMVDKSYASLVVVAIGLGMMIVTFPRRVAVMEWLQQRLTDVKHEMQLIR